eukprot:361553_1
MNVPHVPPPVMTDFGNGKDVDNDYSNDSSFDNKKVTDSPNGYEDEFDGEGSVDSKNEYGDNNKNVDSPVYSETFEIEEDEDNAMNITKGNNSKKMRFKKKNYFLV